MTVEQIEARIREIDLWRHRHITLPQQELRELYGCPVSVKFEQSVLDENTRLVSERRQLDDERRRILYFS